MDHGQTPITGKKRSMACLNCGASQEITGIESRCSQCGTLLTPPTGELGSVGAPLAAPMDPLSVPPPSVAGGLGGVSDGTQVTHHATSAVPGKPVAPIADSPVGNSTDEAQAMDPPAGPQAHVERGGSR